MTTIEANTSDHSTAVTAADHMSLIAVCMFALLGLAGIITMTV
jgi:hypothetical protein